VFINQENRLFLSFSLPRIIYNMIIVTFIIQLSLIILLVISLSFNVIDTDRLSYYPLIGLPIFNFLTLMFLKLQFENEVEHLTQFIILSIESISKDL
jgi:hypothetical protein